MAAGLGNNYFKVNKKVNPGTSHFEENGDWSAFSSDDSGNQ